MVYKLMTDLSVALKEVSAGKFNIFGGYIIGHFEEKRGLTITFANSLR